MNVFIYPVLGMLVLTAPLIAENPPSAQIFDQCHSCHTISTEEVAIEEWVGPNLFGIIGRNIAAIEGFEYSDDLNAAGENGALWDDATLDAFLKNPMEVYPNTTMGFGGIEDDEERAALIAFLKADSDGHIPLNDDPELSEEILAIEGDPDYGEYLSSACVTCHQVDGQASGIPSIIGWPTKRFVTVMHAYKNKHRENPVMQQYAGSLTDDEIAALAAYFEGLGD